LLLYLPYKYLDRSREAGIAELLEGQEVTAIGWVRSAATLPGKRRRFVLVLEDDSGELECIWFAGHQYLRQAFSEGDFLAVAGKVSRFGKRRQMVHPEVEVLNEQGEDTRLHTGRIIPLYSINARMREEKLSSRGIRRLIHDALEAVTTEIVDPLPGEIASARGVVSLLEAVRNIHFPDSMAQVHAARKRLSFEELFHIQLYLGSRLKDARKPGARTFDAPGSLSRRLIEALPFALTEAQSRVLREIWEDLKHPAAMHRLLQGDVGSGKTLVALLSILPVVEGGAQAALMAPTEILAEQHLRTLIDLVKPLGVRAELLTGRLDAVSRRTILAGLQDGEIQILVGTHALLQEDVIFAELGLAVVDEQHRFGVEQRAVLREKGVFPHLMVMTATPIPRTLALTLYGDLDVTVLDELPSGRLPVVTGWRLDKDRIKALEFLKDEVEKGRQAYIVYPAINESFWTELKSATQAFEALRMGPLDGLTLGLLHGQLTPEDKEQVMGAFRAGQIDVLICTTVVEVGVDIPNATVMMVEHAERFGLSQLHQLRGRVGRGQHESYCILLANPEGDLTPEARSRLDTMARSTDGFEIAEMDLQIRGAGHIFGTRQAGVPEFVFADLRQDEDLVVSAREDADSLLASDPRLEKHPPLAGRVRTLAEHWMDISDVG
ncbi:MAG TPA: ATP-dependent DNA helicase RecG, partial [Candidatus Latescibacteria bacterium]|nr:ATP-dependent DNA helicase RecG [Candidatus Latescibacterota bacterium]